MSFLKNIQGIINTKVLGKQHSSNSAGVGKISTHKTATQQRPPSPDISVMKAPLRAFMCGEAALFFNKDVPSARNETIIPKVVASSIQGKPEKTIVISAQRILSDKPPYLTMVASKPEWAVLDGPSERFFEDDDFFLREAIWQIREFQGLTMHPVVEIDLRSKSPIGIFDK